MILHCCDELIDGGDGVDGVSGNEVYAGVADDRNDT